MKSLNEFLQSVLNDLGTRCSTSTTHDLKTVMGRLEHEGMSFLTISLANFGKDFQKSLDQGFVGHDQFLGFSRSGSLPRFLGGFFDRVFDRKCGRLLDIPSTDCIYAIRQFTLMWAKINLPCTLQRERKAIRQYVECEQDVRQSDLSLRSSEHDLFSDFGRIGRLLWAELFSAVDSRIYNESVVPKHGPGATADKLRGNAKYNQLTWTARLEEVFPHWENLIPSESFLQRTDAVTILEPRDEIPVKVITVPKTLESPRIIAVEPTCMQYMQQGVFSVMVEEIARSNHARNLVAFESQEPNQWLAREGSITGSLATLDLSDASDRVSNQHVRLLVANHRWLRLAVDATRSRKADVPGFGEIRLAKFASMGSALCFPMEALVFTTAVFVGIEKVLSRRMTKKDIESFYGRVRIYGDDIIVPVEFVQSVVETLEAFGFRVNTNKSFWTGKFRESCGKDYYDGVDVSIVRVRSIPPRSRLDAEEIESWVSLRNHLFHRGFVEAVAVCDRMIHRIIPFPIVDWMKVENNTIIQASSLLGRHAYEPSQAQKHSKHLHHPLVKGVVVQPNLPESKLDDYGALMKWFLKRGRKPFEDRNHLLRAGRPVSVCIKNRWAAP